MLKKILFAVAAGIMICSGISSVWAATYEVDPTHSSVEFKVKHLLSNTKGTFDEFVATLQYDPEKPETWSVEAHIKTASINTKVADRDKHLKGADFLDVEKYPEMVFKSTKVEKMSETTAKVEGTLLLHGIEKTVTLDLEMHGVVNDPWGNTRAAFTATTQIHRSDFGVVYNKVLETGGFIIGEDVDVVIEIEAIAKK